MREFFYVVLTVVFLLIFLAISNELGFREGKDAGMHSMCSNVCGGHESDIIQDICLCKIRGKIFWASFGNGCKGGE